MNLSIIIVNWNTRDVLWNSLRSIFRFPPKNKFEVLVVDNASIDGSVQMVGGQFPKVRLIENMENMGFARANNQAILHASGDYILLLNPDTEVKPDALTSLVSFMEAHPEAGAAGARLINRTGILQPSCYPALKLSREFWRLFHLDGLKPYASYPLSKWDLETPRQVDVIQGACLILRREVLDQVGCLDEDYFMYTEEVDLCFRIGKAGWSIFWVPQAQVVHYGGESTKQVPVEMFLNLYRSKILFFRKHKGWLQAQVYKLILFAAAMTRLLFSPFTLLRFTPQRQRYLTLARYYRRLLKVLPEL